MLHTIEEYGLIALLASNNSLGCFSINCDTRLFWFRNFDIAVLILSIFKSASFECRAYFFKENTIHLIHMEKSKYRITFSFCSSTVTSKAILVANNDCTCHCVLAYNSF